MTFINPYSFIDALVFQHQRILTLFDRVLATEAEDRDEAFFELRRLLAVHEAAEEVVVHPRARREIDSGESVVADRLEEEESAKRTLTELEQMDIQSRTSSRRRRHCALRWSATRSARSARSSSRCATALMTRRRPAWPTPSR